MITPTKTWEQAQRLREKEAAVAAAFKDINGTQITIGSFVHYAHDRQTDEFASPWRTDRWGIVVGLSKTEVRADVKVVSTFVSERVTDNEMTTGDYFFTTPDNLVVIQ